MKKGWKIFLITIAVVVILIGVGPFLIPVPPLENSATPQELAGPDSRFIELEGLSIHYLVKGEGEPVFILLHGFGASTFSWREVIDPLSKLGTVIVYDRPAFGLSERPLSWEDINPYSLESNINILKGLMDAFDIDQAILVGNSAGGTVATAFALEYPERVQALIEVDAAIYQTSPTSPLLQWLFTTPQMDHLGPLIARRLAGSSGDDFIRSAWHDPSKLDLHPEILEGYRLPLQVSNWDIALWEFTKTSTPTNLAERLDQITIPTLVISGDDDRIVPVENSIQLAKVIPQAQLVILQNCGHLPQEECPDEFMNAILDFLTQQLNLELEQIS